MSFPRKRESSQKENYFTGSPLEFIPHLLRGGDDIRNVTLLLTPPGTTSSLPYYTNELPTPGRTRQII